MIEGEGVEVRFNSYDPKIKEIDVLRFARRRRAKLYYLRDRPAKVSPEFFFFLLFFSPLLFLVDFS